MYKLAGDAEQEKRSVEFLGVSQPALRHALDERLSRVACEELPVDVGFDVAGRERIDPDPVARPFECEHLGHLNDAGL